MATVLILIAGFWVLFGGHVLDPRMPSRHRRSGRGPTVRSRLVLLAVVVGSTVTGVDGASAQTEPPPEPIGVVQLNLFHGLVCDPMNTDWCNAPARVELLGKWLERSECPELVGLQEIAPRDEELIKEMANEVCDGNYTVGLHDAGSPDRELVLTTLPILGAGWLDIANFPWEAWWVRVESPQGPVDFLTAHFASNSNNPVCDATNCPPVCPTGVETNDCHSYEVLDFFDTRPPGAVMQIVAADINAEPDELPVRLFLDGGFTDAWLAAGRPECDPATGKGCTGCPTTETTYLGLDTRKGLACDERIDFIFVRPATGCDLEAAAAGFAHKAWKKPVDKMFWPSDHHGVQATLACALQ